MAVSDALHKSVVETDVYGHRPGMSTPPTPTIFFFNHQIGLYIHIQDLPALQELCSRSWWLRGLRPLVIGILVSNPAEDISCDCYATVGKTVTVLLGFIMNIICYTDLLRLHALSIRHRKWRFTMRRKQDRNSAGV
jgi:hypothetical protein